MAVERDFEEGMRQRQREANLRKEMSTGRRITLDTARAATKLIFPLFSFNHVFESSSPLAF